MMTIHIQKVMKPLRICPEYFLRLYPEKVMLSDSRQKKISEIRGLDDKI